jgi:hypothetical protein
MDFTSLLPMFMQMFGAGGTSDVMAQMGAMPPPLDGGLLKDPSRFMQNPVVPFPGSDTTPFGDRFSGMPPAATAYADQGPPPAAEPPVPLPQPRPMGLGEALSGPTEGAPIEPQGPELPGNYGGRPETNPNLKPIGEPPKPTDRTAQILQMLRTMQAPPAPTPQRVSSPSVQGRAPAGRGDNLMNLLAMMMSQSPGRPGGGPSLGQALLGRG